MDGKIIWGVGGAGCILYVLLNGKESMIGTPRVGHQASPMAWNFILLMIKKQFQL